MEELQTLSPTQQQEVLDFVEFLKNKQHKTFYDEQPEESGVSFLEAAGKYIGCLKGGPPDLSTNKVYMEGFGEA